MANGDAINLLSNILSINTTNILEFPTLSSFPAIGKTGKIYIALDNNMTYRWDNTVYVEISPSLALGETSSTAYRGDRGKTAYDHSQIDDGNPHNTTKIHIGLGNVDDTSDLNKPVSIETQTALNLKANNTIIVNNETERKALIFGSGLNQVQDGTIVLQKNGTGSLPFVFYGAGSTDTSQNSNWLQTNTNAVTVFKPTMRIVLILGQSNTGSYAPINADYYDDNIGGSKVYAMASRMLTGGSQEDTNLYTNVACTANNTNNVIITNTNFFYRLKKGTRLHGTNIPQGTYITNTDLNNDFTTIQTNNIIPNTVTSINCSKLEGAPIQLQALNSGATPYKTLPGYRLGNSQGTGIGYYLSKTIDTLLQENANDGVTIISPFNGSTGFANSGAWVSNTGYLYQETIRLYALAKEYWETCGYAVQLHLGLFCLGEEDSRQGTTTASMKTFMQDLISNLKNNCTNSIDAPAKIPIWLINGLPSYWSNSNLGYSRGEVITIANKTAVDNAFRNLPVSVEGSFYVPFINYNRDYTQNDCIHFSALRAQIQANVIANHIAKARQNTVDFAAGVPENLTINGVQTIGANATWTGLYNQKYDLEWKYSNQDWSLALKVYDLTDASYIVPAETGNTIDVRVRGKKFNGTGISSWSTINNTQINSTIINDQTVWFEAGINNDNNFTTTDLLEGTTSGLKTGAVHIKKWNNKVPNQRHAENLIMGTSFQETTIILTANSNIATVGSAVGIVLNKTFIDIVSVINGNKVSDYSILPRDTVITAINGLQITMSNAAPAIISALGYNVRLRYNVTLNAGGGNLTQTGGDKFGNPVRSKIKNNKNQWLHCLNLQTENNGLIVDDLLDGNYSYSATILIMQKSYNELALVSGSGLTQIVDTARYGGATSIDIGSKNYVSRIKNQSLSLLCTIWRPSSLRVTCNHNTTSGGASDTQDIVVDKWYIFTVTFDRVAGIIKLYKNGIFVSQITNTAVLSAFIGYIGCIDLSNGMRAGSVGANFAAIMYHKRNLELSEIDAVKTYLVNKFNITL